MMNRWSAPMILFLSVPEQDLSDKGRSNERARMLFARKKGPDSSEPFSTSFVCFELITTEP